MSYPSPCMVLQVDLSLLQALTFQFFGLTARGAHELVFGNVHTVTVSPRLPSAQGFQIQLPSNTSTSMITNSNDGFK